MNGAESDSVHYSAILKVQQWYYIIKVHLTDRILHETCNECHSKGSHVVPFRLPLQELACDVATKEENEGCDCLGFKRVFGHDLLVILLSQFIE